MVIRKEDSKTFWLNLISHFIVNQYESQNEKCRVQVVYTENFLLIKGQTTSSNSNLSSEIHKFIDDNEITNKLGKGVNNLISLITSEKITPEFNLSYTFFNTERPLFSPFNDENQIIDVSDLLFGLSLDFKLPYYFLEMVSKDVLKFTKSDYVNISLNNSEVKLNCKSMYKMKDLESCVMDIFDFDSDNFKQKIKSFDFKKEIVEPQSERPWLNDSKIKEFIIF
jgi:hypothetical protein